MMMMNMMVVKMVIFGRYDAATEDRQIVWKKMIINFIERQVFSRSFQKTLNNPFHNDNKKYLICTLGKP